MASILRSAKFVRYVAGFARNVVVNQPREFDGNLIQNTQCFCGAFQRSLATEASAQQPRHDQNLERSLRRLDQDVRRSGRISRRDIEDILEEIRHSRSATSSQSLLVIRCCGNLVPEELPETRTKLVQEIWNTLNKLNVPMDVSHYNALLRVYLENEHLFSPTEFLSDLEAKGIEPNRVTYQRLIARYCQLGDIEGATRILEFMREKQLPVNENVFNALIMGHSNTDDMESAKGILSVMQQAGLEPSADTYTTLLCGYARKGDIESIKNIFEECEVKEIYLLDKDYLDIIFALATNGHANHVSIILSKVRKSVGYNQDAVNLILRLVNHKQEETAMEVLKTLPTLQRNDGLPPQSGNFMIRQMIKANCSKENIISACSQLQESGVNSKAFLFATEMSLQLANSKLAFSLLKELESTGVTIRQHYFWPLIIAKGKQKNIPEMLNVLNEMSKFNMPPSSETIRDYVIPYLSGKSDDMITALRSVGVSVGSAATSILYKYLTEYNLEDGVKLMQRVPAYYPHVLIKRQLNNALIRVNDLNSYLMIIRLMHEYFERRDQIQKETEDEGQIKIDKADMIGYIVLDFIQLRPKDYMMRLESILNGLVEHGLSISNAVAEKIQERLGEKLTPEISSLLGKMTSGELTPIVLEKSEPHYVPSSAMNIPQLERLISNLEAKGEKTNGLKRQLLSLYTRAKDVTKTEELLQTLEKDDFVYSTGIYAQLIDLYAHHENLDKSLEYFNKLMEIDSSVGLDDMKAMKVVELMIKNDKFNEAIDFINQSPNRKFIERTFSYKALCWRILNALAEKGQAEQLKTLFNALAKNSFIEPNNVLLGPLVKVHVINNDLNKAMEEFELCCSQYKSTPWKNDLACKLIQNEDAEKLQTLTDLSTMIHGEVNSLYDLVFAFVECGRIRQARKILETPGLQSRPQRLNFACERYQEEGMVRSLEGLVEATKDLNHINRNDIYFQLLLSYKKSDDPEKALGLWTQMQEENMNPTDEFLITLSNFLKEKNIKVPFIVPENINKTETHNKVTSQDSNKVKSEILMYRNALKTGNFDTALELKTNALNFLNTTDYSLLIEGLVKEERMNDATKICLEMLNKNIHPIPRVFRFYLNKVANTGNVQIMEMIGSKLSSDMKKLLSFDNRLCHANIMAGKSEEYMKTLEKEIDNVTDDQVQILAEKFPRGGAVGILEKCPELTDQYEVLAQKYAKRGVIAPMNVLWAQHFINNNTESADRVWKTYLENTPRIMFQRVVQLARETKDESLIRRLIEHLKSTKVSDGALGNAYSCLLDVLVSLDKNDETIQIFEQATQSINLEYINRTALLRVKEVFEKSGKSFQYQIPNKNVKKTMSSDE